VLQPLSSDSDMDHHIFIFKYIGILNEFSISDCDYCWKEKPRKWNQPMCSAIDLGGL